jgi:xylulokinase
MAHLFAGIDSSTQSTKLVIIDDDRKEMIYKDSVIYDQDLPEFGTVNGVAQGLEAGASESDPLMWIQALAILFERLQQSDLPQHEIKCISVSGQQHGLVTLDSQGSLTRRRSKLWNDFSTEEECRLLTEAVGGDSEMIAKVGNSQRTGYTAAKIFHLKRHEPEAFQKTSTCFLVHNYINWYLTGGVCVMEPGDVSGMALWHPQTRAWSEKVLTAISPDLKAKLPPVLASDATIGFISAELASRFGLDPRCRIDAGSGDNMYGAVGTGNVEPGIVTVSLGTSGTAYTCMEQAYIDPSGEIAAFCDSTGRYLPLLCVSNLANGYNALVQQYGLTHEAFNEIISRTAPGNKGRLLIPWYVGERTPDVPLAAPVYFGFGVQEFNRENLCRAVLEGHILNLYDGFRKMPIRPAEIRLTGGLAQSHAWCQTIADIFEAEAVPVEGEGAALGAALHAAWVFQKESGQPADLAHLVRPYVIMREDRRCKPIPAHSASHRLQKQVFQALSERVRGKNTGLDPFALREQMNSLYTAATK